MTPERHREMGHLALNRQVGVHQKGLHPLRTGEREQPLTAAPSEREAELIQHSTRIF